MQAQEFGSFVEIKGAHFGGEDCSLDCNNLLLFIGHSLCLTNSPGKDHCATEDCVVRVGHDG